MIPSQWSRLSLWSMLSFLVQALKAGWQLLVAWVIGGSSFLQRSELEGSSIWMALAAGGLFLLAVQTVWSWLFFRWRVDSQRVEIAKGLLFRSQLQLSFDRIQRVDVTTPLWYRPLSRVNLVLESAGSSQKEVTLAALRIDDAEALRTQIRGHQASSTEPASELTAQDHDPGDIVHRLDFAALVKIGLSTPTALVAFPVLWGLYAQLPNDRRTQVENWLQGPLHQLADGGLLQQWGFWILTLLMLVLLSLVSSIALTTLRWYGFVLRRHSAVLRQRAGLLSVREQDVRPIKVQQIVYRRNPLQRLLGIGQLKLTQASSSENEKTAFVVPGIGPEQAQWLQDAIHQTGDREHDPWQSISNSWYGMAIRFGLVFPFLVMTLAFWLTGASALTMLLAGLAWSLGFLVWARRRYSLWSWRRNADVIAVRSGLLGTREVSVDLCRVQRVDMHQSPYQRRRRVATVVFWVPSGHIQLPFIPMSTARQLTALGMWRAATTTRAWM